MAASRSCIVTGIRHRTTFHAPPATGIAGTGTVHPPSPRELRLASTPTVPPPIQRGQSAAPTGGGVGKLPSHRGHPFSVTIVDVGDCHGMPSECPTFAKRTLASEEAACARRAWESPGRYQAKSGSMPRSNSGERSCKEAIRAIVMVLKPSGAAPCHSLQNADCSARRQRPLIMPLTWPARMACLLPRRTCVTRGYATTRSLVSCLVPGTSIASMNVPAYRPNYHIHQKPGTPARRLSDS